MHGGSHIECHALCVQPLYDGEMAFPCSFVDGLKAIVASRIDRRTVLMQPLNDVELAAVRELDLVQQVGQLLLLLRGAAEDDQRMAAVGDGCTLHVADRRRAERLARLLNIGNEQLPYA